jgi:periplasmic nitrate reductase NapD
LNISSVIVHPGPGRVEDVRSQLAALNGIEIHAVAEDGRMIVTIEADNDGAMADAYDAINKTDGVMSAAMVYHQTESDPDKQISVEA